MKRGFHIVFPAFSFFLFWAIATPCFAADATGAERLVVRTLEKPLPINEEKRIGVLWDLIAGGEDEKFPGLTTERWQENYAVFAEALVRKASEQSLNAESLRKILDLVLEKTGGRTAYLPTGAIQSRYRGKPVWIVTLRWEYPRPGQNALPLGHVRAYAFEQKSLKQVGFASCK